MQSVRFPEWTLVEIIDSKSHMKSDIAQRIVDFVYKNYGVLLRQDTNVQSTNCQNYITTDQGLICSQIILDKFILISNITGRKISVGNHCIANIMRDNPEFSDLRIRYKNYSNNVDRERCRICDKLRREKGKDHKSCKRRYSRIKLILKVYDRRDLIPEIIPRLRQLLKVKNTPFIKNSLKWDEISDYAGKRIFDYFVNTERVLYLDNNFNDIAEEEKRIFVKYGYAY